MEPDYDAFERLKGLLMAGAFSGVGAFAASITRRESVGTIIASAIAAGCLGAFLGGYLEELEFQPGAIGAITGVLGVFSKYVWQLVEVLGRIMVSHPAAILWLFSASGRKKLVRLLEKESGK